MLEVAVERHLPGFSLEAGVKRQDKRACFRCVLLLTLLFGVSPADAQQGAADGQWPTYGGDHGSTKYAPLDQIDRETVGGLEVVWRWESPDNAIVTANRTALPTIPAAFKATPILVDGVLYTKTSMSQAVEEERCCRSKNSTTKSGSSLSSARRRGTCSMTR